MLKRYEDDAKRDQEHKPEENRGGQSNYLVGPILRACEVLKAFRAPGETLALYELVSRTRPQQNDNVSSGAELS